MSNILNEVTIQPQDIPAVLTERFQDIVVYKADLPNEMNSVSMVYRGESIFSVIVSKEFTYDMIINHLRFHANDDLAIANVTDRMNLLNHG